MSALTLDKANAIIETALAFAQEARFRPLGIAVLDAGGHLVAAQRQDGASILRIEIGSGKAFGALSLGVGSRTVTKHAMERPHFMQGLAGVSGGKVVPVPGGVLIRDGSGAILGAVGISGDTSDNDEAAAIAGIEKAGFTAEP